MARLPGMFSAVGTTPTTRIGALSSAMARSAAITAAPPAMSYFIFSMPSAGLIEMPPVSNVTPLPTRPEHRRRRRAGRIVAQHDHARRLGAAARDAEQQAHPAAHQLVFVEDLDAQAGVAADRRGAIGEHRRRQHVRGLVAEVAGDVARLAENAAALHRPLQRPRHRHWPALTTTVCSAGGPPRSPLL